MRLILALLLAGSLAGPAQAALPVSCAVIRYYVSLFGEAHAIKWALAQGWSRRDIAEARKCLR
jgi:hypothetical protein